jgi:protein-S-isoprenylcysteine O-methyltransferase Ste14
MNTFLISIVWTVPFAVLQWLGMPWGWALLATVPIMAVIYLLYWRWVDRTASRWVDLVRTRRDG